MPEDQAALHGGYKRGVTGGRATSANKSSSAALAGSGLGASGGLGDGNKMFKDARLELSLLRSFRKGERDLGSASAHRASGPAAWEIQLSSRLFSLLPPTHPACENLRDLDSM